jgi:mono/diheme cytochrome c family protein
MKVKGLITAALIVPALALAIMPGPSATAGAAVDAAAIFKTKCAACHGAKAEKAFNREKSDDQLLNAVLKGVKPKMPAYETSLGAETCKALVAYMKSLK